jgi:hypothetical protein
MTARLLLAAALLATSPLGLRAQDVTPPATPAAEPTLILIEPVLTQDDLDAAVEIENLSIPTPGEFFAAINKIDRPNWSQLDRPGPLAATTSRARLSLNVGTRVADGFIAVEAQDGQQVKNTGKDIIDLARGLGVSETIIARGNSIGDFADNNEWTALKEELEATENEVKFQMAAQKDEPLIILVTVGAWIRGMQAASEVISTNYSPLAAELLRQPAIVAYLGQRLAALPDRMAKDELIQQLRTGIQSIGKTTDLPPDETLTEKDVAAVRATTTSLVNALNDATPES